MSDTTFKLYSLDPSRDLVSRFGEIEQIGASLHFIKVGFRTSTLSSAERDAVISDATKAINLLQRMNQIPRAAQNNSRPLFDDSAETYFHYYPKGDSMFKGYINSIKNTLPNPSEHFTLDFSNDVSYFFARPWKSITMASAQQEDDVGAFVAKTHDALKAELQDGRAFERMRDIYREIRRQC